MTAPARFNAGDQTRRLMIAKVKIAQKELAMDDGAYREMLKRLTGQISAAACSVAQLGVVLDELKAKGWGRPGGTPAMAKAKRADHPAAGKARALWISLFQLGVVRDRRESALESFAGRQLKIEKLQWADQGHMYRLIEALKAMAERHGWSQDVTGIPAERQVNVLKQRLEILIEQRRREAEADMP